jgi:hypothetical protein
VSRPAAVEAIAALSTALGERRWRWYVFGAQAVLVYGRPRLTADLDVVIEPAKAGPEALVALLACHGFALRFEVSEDHLRAASLLPMVHASSSLPVDVVIAAPGLHEELLARAQFVDLGGVVAPVISAEDLLALKFLAGRRKDLEDVRGVLAEQGDRLDLARTRDLLTAFEAASGDPRLLARLDRLVRAMRRARTPRPRS